jgi:SLT domain-containing protein
VKTYVILAVTIIALTELAVVWSPRREMVMIAVGVVAALGVLGARWMLSRQHREAHDESQARDPAESLRRWLARTETLVARAETTRADWDKHLRPMLARQFELATGQLKRKDANAFQATADMVFGAELWQWVDPDNVSPTGNAEPGPGRAVLDEVLQRLQRI